MNLAVEDANKRPTSLPAVEVKTVEWTRSQTGHHDLQNVTLRRANQPGTQPAAGSATTAAHTP
jgi:hypothetical protein